MAGIGLSMFDPARMGQAGEFAITSPADIPGLFTWLDAAVGPKDGSGVAITVDGTAVKTWTDQAGSGLSPAQATADLQPLWKANILNGLPVVQFDGSNDTLAVTSDYISQPNTMFFVVRDLVYASTKSMFDGITAARWTLGVEASGLLSFWVNSGTKIPLSLATTTWMIVGMISNGANSKFGVLTDVPVACASPGTNQIAGLILGANHVGGTPNDIQVAQYLWYQAALTDEQFGGVIRWLATKFALDLTGPVSGLIANDTFESYAAEASVNGLTGGTGWSGNWIAKS